MLIAGVDEAGRGPVIGPMVVAGVLVDEEGVRRLREAGVRDSKELSPQGRKALKKVIEGVAIRSYYVVIPPREVDEAVERGGQFNLNYLEARAMAKVIGELRPDVAYVDSPDVSESRFRLRLEAMLPFKVKVIAEHKADAKYEVVGAASILAKVRRDDIIEELRGRYGDFGSGYPADPRTVEFLKKWAASGEYPEIVRRSWRTAKAIMEEAKRERGPKLL